MSSCDSINSSLLLGTLLVYHIISSPVSAQTRTDGQDNLSLLIPGYLETSCETRLRRPTLAYARSQAIRHRPTGSPTSLATHCPL